MKQDINDSIWKIEILKNLSGIPCPNCKEKLFVGSIRLWDQTPALYCGGCNLRYAIPIIMVEEPIVGKGNKNPG